PDFADGFDDFPVRGQLDPELVPAVHGEVLAHPDHGSALGKIDDLVEDRPESQAGEEARLSQARRGAIDLKAGVFPLVSWRLLGRRPGSHVGHIPKSLLKEASPRSSLYILAH